MKKLSALALFLHLTSLNVAIAADEVLPNWRDSGLPASGVRQFEAQFERDPTNQNRFNLAAFRFMAGIEQLAQELYRYDPSSAAARLDIPFLRLPLPSNPDPEEVTPAALRGLFEQFYRHLQGVDAILKDCGDAEFKAPLALGEIKLDVTGDGVGTALVSMLTGYNPNVAPVLSVNAELMVHFDLADAHWLRGYSNLLMAMLDTALAHDWGAVYDQSAHFLFARANTPTAALARDASQRFDTGMIADVIAVIHVMNLPVLDKERLARGRTRLLSVVQSSRGFWHQVATETDDDKEWIPNSSQRAVTGTRISGEMSAAWLALLDEAEKVLNGDKLVPHWRVADGRGVNLRRVFEEATSFDPLLWAHGIAAIPFLEQGERTSMRTWRRLMRVFGGDFLGFAVWVN